MTQFLRLNLLGTPQILIGDQLVTGFATTKAQALLFYLAASAKAEAAQPVHHSRDAVATLLWGEMTDKKAKQNLRTVLSDLRRTVGEHLLIDRQLIAFDHTSPYWLDVAALRRDLSLTPSSENLSVRQTAVSLYRGEFLSGFNVSNAPEFESWMLDQRQKLHILMVQALFTLVSDHIEREDFAAGLVANLQLLALEPWSEPVHRQQMLLLAHQGERSAALAQFEACQQILAQEFGVAPLPETIALYEQIRAGVAQGQREADKEQTPLPDRDRPRTSEATKLPSGPVEAPIVLVNERELPQRVKLFGREKALSSLQKWVCQDACRLAGILGMGGQGKSTLAAAFVRSLAKPDNSAALGNEAAGGRFQKIIWKSLLNAPPLAEVMQEWFYLLSGQTVITLPDSLDQQFSQLLTYLREQRTLLVLDNLESILLGDGRSGTFRPGYEAYEQLLRHLAVGQHDSCLLFTSRELPQILTGLEEDTAAVRFLSLPGLPADAGQQMLAERGVAGGAALLGDLVQHYSGNPLALKLAAETVDGLFAGSIKAFLHADARIFDNIRDVLDQQFARLSTLEYELMLWLAVVREPVTFAELRLLLAKPPTTRQVLEAMRSLQRRSLLEQFDGRFGLQNVVMEYSTELLIDRVVGELIDNSAGTTPSDGVTHLNRFALVLVQTKAYVRATQTRLLLKPVTAQLKAQLGVLGAERQLKMVLAQLHAELPAPGYAAANLLHLMLHAGVELRGYDFSGLYLRQLYLRGVNLPQINFAGAEIVESVFTEPFGIVNTTVFSPDNRYVAAGTNEGTIYIWRMADQQLDRVIQAHSKAIDVLAFAQRKTASGEQQLLLASASNDGRLGVWGLAERKPDRWHLYLTAPEQGTMSFVAANGRFITGINAEGQVFVWDIADLERPFLINTYATAATRFGLMGYSDNGQLVAVGNRNGMVQIHHAQTGEQLHQFRVGLEIPSSLALSEDGRLLVVGGKYGQLGLWRISHDEVQPVGQTFLRITKASIDAVAISPDGKKCATTHGVGDQTVRLWSIDPEAGLQLEQTMSGHTHIIWSAAFSSQPLTDSEVLGVGRPLLVTGSSDQTVRVWDVETGQSLYTHHGQPRALSTLAIHPLSEPPGKNEWLLAAVGYDHQAHLWRGHGHEAGPEWRTLLGSEGALYGAAISRDGRFLATAGHDKLVYLWDIANGQLRRTFRGHTNSIYKVDFHPDGNLLASGSTDGTVRLWPIDLAQGHQATRETLEHQPVAIIRAHPMILYDMAISADGRLLATAGTDRNLRLWDLTQSDYPELEHLRKTIGEPGERNITSVAFSPDGSNVACGSNGIVHLWNVCGSQEEKMLCQHTLPVMSLSFSPDGALLASSGEDWTVCLWHVACGTLCHQLVGHGDTVYKVAFTPDGAYIISCSLDGTIKFWSAKTGRCVNTLQVDGPYEGMNIAGITGITEAEKAALKVLGAVEA